jgi:hypothetical protein
MHLWFTSASSPESAGLASSISSATRWIAGRDPEARLDAHHHQVERIRAARTAISDLALLLPHRDESDGR